MSHSSITRAYPSKPAAKAITLVEAIISPEFVVVATFCTTGLLVTLDVMLRFPDFWAILG